MGLIDRLRKAGGIAKNRLASSVGALRGVAARGAAQLRGVRVRVPSRIGRLALAGRRVVGLTTPIGLGITAATFAPQIIRAGRVVVGAIGRGIAFVGGRQVVTAAGAGGVVGVLTGRRKGEVTRPSETVLSPPIPGARERGVIDVTGRIVRPRAGRTIPEEERIRERAGRRRRRRAPTERAPRRRAPARRKRIPTHRHKVISVPVTRRRTARRGTHRRPRHRGHTKVSFTTKEGKKVSFLANPLARHR